MAGRGRPLSGGVTSQLVTKNSKEEEGCEHCWGRQGGLLEAEVGAVMLAWQEGSLEMEEGGGDAGAGKGVFNDTQGEAETLTLSPQVTDVLVQLLRVPRLRPPASQQLPGGVWNQHDKQ